MDWFKSATTVEYIHGIKQHGWPRFTRRLRLDGYYDHVIRDDRDLSRIRSYIESNAANWQKDGYYAS
jgi:putative transposase